jgi:hypothetical protein
MEHFKTFWLFSFFFFVFLFHIADHVLYIQLNERSVLQTFRYNFHGDGDKFQLLIIKKNSQLIYILANQFDV